MNRVQRARGINQIMTGVFYLIAVFFFTLLIGFASYVIIKGFTGATPEMFAFARKGSIGNQLFNTIYLVFLVYFGLGKSLLAGALSISILAIPVITTTTEDAINGLPGHYLQASLGLGATRWQSIYHVLIPACIPRIMTGVILAAGRGFGEAAALLYTTGSGTDLRWNNWNLTSPTCPLNIFRPAETLSLQIWGLQINGQDPNLANLSAAILMILVLLFSIGANALSRHINKKNSGN